MAYKLTHEELLRRIVNYPSTILARQMAISSEATSLMLRNSRRLHGVMNHSDELELSAKIVSAIRYIAEHDYLFYLYCARSQTEVFLN